MKRNHTVARYSKITEFDKANISRAYFFFFSHFTKYQKDSFIKTHTSPTVHFVARRWTEYCLTCCKSDVQIDNATIFSLTLTIIQFTQYIVAVLCNCWCIYFSLNTFSFFFFFIHCAKTAVVYSRRPLGVLVSTLILNDFGFYSKCLFISRANPRCAMT